MEFDLNKKECEKVGGVHDGMVCLSKDEKFDGKYQSMNFGRLVSNPNFLFKMKKSDKLYGDFDASTDHLDRVVSMEKDLTISEKDRYIEEHEPEIELYYIMPKGESGIIKKKIYTPIIKHTWKELGEI